MKLPSTNDVMLRINEVALRANGHALGVIWRETVEIVTDLWYNETKKAHINQYGERERKMSIEQKLSHDWFIHADDKDKRLYVSREKPNPSGALSPCNMSPDDVDYEMSKGKNKKVIELCGMEQKSFE